jgi:hypothetical protein
MIRGDGPQEPRAWSEGLAEGPSVALEPGIDRLRTKSEVLVVDDRTAEIEASG